MNAIADAIQPSALEALLTQTLADEAGLNDVAEGFKPILAYVASLASNQCVAETFHMFEWEKTCKAYLTPILADEEKCAAVTKKFMDESEKRVPKREVELDIPEGEGEILCNVEFKLAYGGKILLNTTHFHVRRGRIYGLLGHNGCGKSTLVRSLVKRWTKQNVGEVLGPMTVVTGKKRRVTLIECPNDMNAMCDVSKIADLANLGAPGGGGSITAALFLKEFVSDTAWAHLDIAGPVWNEKAGGATGFGVRTLAAYAEAQAL